MTRAVAVEINGRLVEAEVEPRLLLADFIRDTAGLTGTHLGCEHGVCGACTVQFDGTPVRSCLLFAVQAHGHAIATVEGMAPSDETLHPLQQAFHECHALQCGFCTPGILMTMEAFLRQEFGPIARADKGRARGQPVSVHWLSEHRQRCAPGSRQDERARPRRRPLRPNGMKVVVVVHLMASPAGSRGCLCDGLFTFDATAVTDD